MRLRREPFFSFNSPHGIPFASAGCFTVILRKADSPATPAKRPTPFLYHLRPDRLPEGVVDVAFKEVYIPVVGDLHAGVAQELRDVGEHRGVGWKPADECGLYRPGISGQPRVRRPERLPGLDAGERPLIYGRTMADPVFKAPADCRLTQSEDGKRLYVHLFAYPFAHLQLLGFAGKLEYAQFLHDASELKFKEGKVDHFSEGAAQAENLLVVELPPVKPDAPVPVVELFLKPCAAMPED